MIEEEKSFYKAKWGYLDSFLQSLSPDSDRRAIFPDGLIHGDTHMTFPVCVYRLENLAENETFRLIIANFMGER